MKANLSYILTASFLTAVLTFNLSGCSSKKKVEDEAAAPVTSDKPPVIDSSATMNFDPSGSDSGKIEGLYSINFDYDKANLTTEAKKKMEANAAWMKKNPNVNMQIEGHCDDRGSVEYNLALGERRALSVKKYLTSLGISGNHLSIVSYGKEKPLVNGDSESDYAKNRRANFLPLTQ